MTVRTPWTPYPHQSAVIAVADQAFGKGIIIPVKSKRQVGKTTMAEDILLRYAFNFRRPTLSVLVEPTLDQSRRVYRELVRTIADLPILARKNDSLLELEFVNGSSILFKSAEQRDSLRGFTITGILIVDECAFIQDEIYDILQPSTDVHSAPILLISSPKLKQGFFYRYYQAGREGANENIVSIDFNDFDTSMFLSPDKLEQYRTMMPRAQFTTEYLGEFLDTDSILFSNIKECIAPAPETYGEVYGGIDWGSGTGGDYTSVCLVTDENRMLLLRYFNDKATYEQIQYICELLAPYKTKLRRLNAESNSIGKPMTDLLLDEFTRRGWSYLRQAVNPFTTTNAEKARLVSQMQVELEQKTVTLLNDPGLISQLTAYEATYNPKTGLVTYNAPQGLHDDNCISSMLAVDARNNTRRYGQYTIGFRNKPRAINPVTKRYDKPRNHR